jgi:MFS family permease
VLIIAVKEPKRRERLRDVRMPLQYSELVNLGSGYGRVLALATVFTLARFSEAFLVLRAQPDGVPLMLIPAVLVVMNIAYSLSAYPIGALSDRIDRVTILLAGVLLLIAADVVLALLPGIVGLMIGTALWGLHMGFTQGSFAALIADTAPPELRGTAFGVFNLVTGLALLLASVVAGLLWDRIGPQGTFLAGAAFAFVALLGLMAIRSQRAR